MYRLWGNPSTIGGRLRSGVDSPLESMPDAAPSGRYYLEAVKKVSHRHSPADLSGFFALNTRLILRFPQAGARASV